MAPGRSRGHRTGRIAGGSHVLAKHVAGDRGVACALIVGLIALGDRSARPSFGVRANALKLTLALALVGLVALYIGAAAGSTTMWDRVLNPLGDESVTDRLNTNADALEAHRREPSARGGSRELARGDPGTSGGRGLYP